MNTVGLGNGQEQCEARALPQQCRSYILLKSALDPQSLFPLWFRVVCAVCFVLCALSFVLCASCVSYVFYAMCLVLCALCFVLCAFLMCFKLCALCFVLCASCFLHSLYCAGVYLHPIQDEDDGSDESDDVH